MNKIKVLICADRDGTITHDENTYLGRDKYWKSQVKLLPGVIRGIKLLNAIAESHFFIITNQSPVGIKEFKELTEKRVSEVNDYLVLTLHKKGCIVDKHYSACYADSEYFKKYIKKGYSVDPKYVKENYIDRKPNIGMVKKCARYVGEKLNKSKVYVIGDRASDVMTGINAKGIGILVPTFKTLEGGEEEKVKKLMKQYPGRVFVCDNFYSAAKLIKKDLMKIEEK